MDHRRENRESQGHWNSYRPAADDRRQQSRNRPNQPDRRNSRFDVEPRNVRSPDNPPAESPHSPRAKHGESSSSAANVRLSISRDPRKPRDPATEPPPTKEVSTNSPATTLEDVIRELAKQFGYEEKVKEVRSNLKVLQEEQQEKMEMFSNSPALLNILQDKSQKMEHTLSGYSQLAIESRDRAEKLVGDLPPSSRHLLRHVDATPVPVPNPPPADRASELDELKTSMKGLVEKLDVLMNQNKEQEMEIKRLREETPRAASKNLEHEIDSKVSVVKKDVESRFTSIEQVLGKLENNKHPSGEDFEHQEEHSIRQNDEIRSLRLEQTKLSDLVMSLQKKIEVVETQSAQNTVRETSRVSFRDDRDDEFTTIQEQQREQKRQVANLSNTFVSHKEYQELCLESDTTKTLVEKQLHEAAKAHSDVVKRIDGIDERTTQLCGTVDDLELKLREIADKSSKASQDEIQSLEQSQERLQKQCERLESELDKLITWRATKESDTQIPAYNAQQLTKLEIDVKKLHSFRPHYNKFYEETQDVLKEIRKQCSDFDKVMKDLQNGQNSVRFRLGSIEETNEETQKSISDVSNQNKKLMEQQLAFQGSIQNQISTLKTSNTQSIESLSSQTKIAMTDIETLKVKTKQANHSIQSLDSRYNGISTQKLYHAIVATIQPLLPEMYDTSNKVKILQTSMTTYVQNVVELNDKLKRIEKKRAEKDSVQQDTADPGANATSAVPTTSSRRAPHLQVASPGTNDNLVLRETVAQLKQSHVDHVSHLQKVEGDLATLHRALKDENQSKITKDHLAGLLKEAWGELVKNFTSEIQAGEKALDEQKRHTVLLDEARKKIDNLETALEGDRKLLDSLKADIGLVEDLQSRVQSIQTDVKTHQTRLDQVETNLPQIAETEKRPSDLRTCKKFLHGDRYVVLHNIASNITEKRLREKFGEGCEVKTLKILGGKVAGTKISTRYALISLATSQVVDEKLRAFKNLHDPDRKVWSGRLPRLRVLDRQLFLELWVEESNSVVDLFPELPGSTRPVVASAPSIASREVSTAISAQSETQSEEAQTIRISDSSMPSAKPSGHEDLTELPDSEDENTMNGELLLAKFNAAHNGQKPGRPSPLRKTIATPTTPSVRVGKRAAAADLGSSRGSSKRSRRE